MLAGFGLGDGVAVTGAGIVAESTLVITLTGILRLGVDWLCLLLLAAAVVLLLLE